MAKHTHVYGQGYGTLENGHLIKTTKVCLDLACPDPKRGRKDEEA